MHHRGECRYSSGRGNRPLGDGGAGTVATHNVPAFALVTGNPDRLTGWVCPCGQKLGGNLTVQSPANAVDPTSSNRIKLFRRNDMSLESCQLVDFPKITDPRGNLTFIEGAKHVPFSIQRVYYLYDVPGGAERGGHAHKEMHQLIIAMSGSFDVILDDGSEKKRFHLNRSYYGLYVCPMIWRELDNFSSGSVCLVLASNLYDEGDYYRNYDTYLEALKATK
jgi:hypothetical protein